MYSKIIFNIILIFGLASLQIAFISGLPLGLNNLNLILVVLIFILGLAGLDYAIWWAIGLGFILDSFSFSAFGVYLASLAITIIIANYLLNNFFTNRSLYSFLALIFFSSIIYELCLITSNYFIYLTENASQIIIIKDFFKIKAIEFGLNLLASIFLFYIIHFISKRLRPVFLLKPNK